MRTHTGWLLARLLALPALTLIGPSCGMAQPPAGAAAGLAADKGADFATTLERALEDEDSFTRFNSIHWAADALDKHEAFIKAQAAALASTDFAGLSQTGKVDYLLLRNYDRSLIAHTELARRQLAEMDPVLGVRTIIVPLEEARWRMEKLDPKAAAGELARIPGMVKDVRERLERGMHSDHTSKPPADAIVLTPVVAQRAAAALGALNGTLHTWYSEHNTYEPAFAWWCGRPYETAHKDIEDLAQYLRETVAGIHNEPSDPLIGDPIGREALLAELRNEYIAATPEELIDIANREFAWCEKRMKEASAEMGCGDDWKAALEKVKQDAPDVGEQSPYVAGLAKEAIAFIHEHDFVTIPPLCEQTWRLAMLSPQTQRVLPFAVYLGQAIGVASPSSDMTYEDKLMSMRGNNRHFTRNVVPHELIPGHHLQGFMEDRILPYRKRFSTPFLVEGWAVYWEMKLLDNGWAKSPQDRVGILFWRMHRCARIIVSLKFHLGEMTPQQMVDFLVDRVGHERFGATSEVRRFIGGEYSPLYQCGYMIGALQLRALHDEMVPAKMSEKAFNDAVLTCGAIPIELIRAQLEGTPLTPSSEAGWKFAFTDN